MREQIKQVLRTILTEEYNIKDDLKILEKFAMGVKLISLGEYGIVYYNPDKNKIFITIGDSSPFDDEILKDWVLNSFYELLDGDENRIEVENEAGPDDEEDGWLVFKNDKFIPWEGHC